MSDYAVIIAGGRIDEDFALRFLRKQMESARPFLVAADRGLLFLERFGIVPDLVAGDFDSAGMEIKERFKREHPQTEVLEFNWEKDDTDTQIAALAAAKRGCRVIDILGATGTRLDHVFGAVHLLALLLDMGIRGRILDPCNRITMHEQDFSLRKDEQWGKYVSFFPWGGEVHGVTLKGFHFPLEDETIVMSATRTVSNQIDDETAEIHFRSGRIIMVESRD